MSHYVVFSWIMAGRKVGVVLKSIVFFSFYVHISFIFTNRVSVYFLFENETIIPFDLIKTLSPTSICAVYETLHVDAAIFIS